MRFNHFTPLSTSSSSSSLASSVRLRVGSVCPRLPLLGLASSAHLCQLAHCCVSCTTHTGACSASSPPIPLSLSLGCSACAAAAAAAVRAYYWCAENVCVIAMLTFVFFAHLSSREGCEREREAGGGKSGLVARPLSPAFISLVICASCAAWGQCKSTIQVHLLATS